ncbi:hypothetical protein CesoFtcFv8_021602 [Champsocephalus esox]|uniref:Uncharacterized protein n=1 Tax=Champsocephalus esox TaxID=159716 RepID=A0AAN8B8T8_9TELE|nr:hypothetical protein CesoFtcFv8_021602 [Champsocephalus esox]
MSEHLQDICNNLQNLSIVSSSPRLLVTLPPLSWRSDVMWSCSLLPGNRQLESLQEEKLQNHQQLKHAEKQLDEA